jgi:hypothetical protein
MTECGTLDFPSLASCGHARQDRQMGSLVISSAIVLLLFVQPSEAFLLWLWILGSRYNEARGIT